jgi:transcriptional/translational regulatory protein YebC/TACO1
MGKYIIFITAQLEPCHHNIYTVFMAGHSKWSQIKHKKAVTDAKKSKIFSKIVRMLSSEARIAKGNKNAPGLRAVIEKAKAANMPGENIDRAIKKATEPGAVMESITYESYGPGGVGVIIEALTENKNKAAAEIKHILSNHHCTLASIGSVTWAFARKITDQGFVWEPTTTVPISDEDSDILEALINELENNDEVQEVFTNTE